MRHQARDGVGRDDGVGVDADENLGVADVLDAVVERFGLAGVGLAEDEHAALGLFLRRRRVRATSSVRSLEPSSITMTRRFG